MRIVSANITGSLILNNVDVTDYLVSSSNISSSVNSKLNSLQSSTSSLNSFTSSYSTGSFTGSFKGDGTNLYNIPATGVTGLQLDKIASGAVTASVSANGFNVNSNVSITGSIVASGTSLVSGSSQINITGTTEYSTFSSSISTSIGSLSSSVATTTSGLSSSLSSSIGSLSSSVATTTVGTKNRVDSIEAKTGSYATTGSNTFIGTENITGNLTVTGSVIISSGSAVYNSSLNLTDTSSLTLNSGSNLYVYDSGIISGTFKGSVTGSLGINGNVSITGSIVASGTSLVSGSSQIDIASTTNYTTFSSSVSSSIGNLSSSVATTTLNLSSSVSSSIGSLSSSVATTTSDLSSSIGLLSSSVATNTSGLAGRITTIEGNYATTGSNVFVGSQVITGSLYITTDLIVQGSSSLQNITASAVSIGTNTVILNTDTPAVRFAGISVQDSGSNAGVTGSIFWDGLCNRWVYSNPSGIGYSGGLLISGPRNTGTLGDEVGTTSCALMMGQGGDHITSSAIFHYGNATCIPNTLAGGIGCFSDAICTLNASVSSCLGVGVNNPQGNFEVVGLSYFTRSNNSLLINPNYGGANTHSQIQVVCNMALAFATNGDNERMRINSSGNVLINCSRSEYGQLQVSTLPTTAGAYASALGLGFLANACEGASTGISFYTKISLGGSVWENARISTFTDGVSSSAYGALAFSTMNATTLSERMRIGNNGFIGVNTTNALSRFDVALQSGESFTIGNCSNTITCGDLIGALTFVSRDASTNSTGGIAGIRSYATQTYNTGGVEGDLRFYTSIVNSAPNGTILSGSEVLKLSQDGVACFCGKICAPTGIFSSKVGIGETAPVSSLVVSTPSDTTSIAQSGIVIQGSSTLTAGCVMALSFVAIPGTTRARAAIGSIVGSDWGKGNLTFYTRDSSDSTALSTADEKMRITSGGLVGIGINSPSYTLDVQSNVASEPYVQARFLNTNSSGAEYGGILVNGTSQAHIRFLTGTSTWNGGGAKQWQIRSGIGGNTDALSIYSWTKGSDVIYFNSCGNVGIGESSPGNDKMVILGTNTHNNVWLRLKTDGCHGIKPAIHFDSGLVGTNRPSKVIMMGGYSSPDGGQGGALVIYTNDTNETSQQRMCIDPRGAVTIMGALAKGSGSFRICHPLPSKVNTHALVHSFIEGPNADLIYSGHIKLTNGVACINIDCSARMTQGTFEALNRCVRIFTTNETSWDAVRGKVCGNMVVIESQNNSSEDEISWMVIGERQDQHMFDTEWTDSEGRVITEPEIVIVNDDDIV